ncbi:MAG: hypothetical protein ACRCZJ_04445 [Erysipelotrichaceae bacterium]
MIQTIKDYFAMYYLPSKRDALVEQYFQLSKNSYNNYPLTMRLFSYGSSIIVILLAFGMRNYAAAFALCGFDLIVAPFLFAYTIRKQK